MYVMAAREKQENDRSVFFSYSASLKAGNSAGEGRKCNNVDDNDDDAADNDDNVDKTLDCHGSWRAAAAGGVTAPVWSV
jgi:hypothetical protein